MGELFKKSWIILWSIFGIILLNVIFAMYICKMKKNHLKNSLSILSLFCNKRIVIECYIQ